MDKSDLYDEHEEAQYRAAIQASLEDAKRQSSLASSSSRQVPNFVDLTADSESERSPHSDARDSKKDALASNEVMGDSDQELDRAIKLSLQKQDSLGHDGEGESIVFSSLTKRSAEMVASRSPGILGIDRKKMEEERLARLDRKRKTSPLAASPVVKRAAVLGEEERVPSRVTASGVRLAANDVRKKEDVAPSTDVPAQSSTSLEFPTGSVKKTWAFGYDRNGDDIKIEEVIQKSDLELAVLSSYIWDADWLFSKFDIKKSRFILIMGEKEEDKKRELENDTKSMGSVRLCFPPMEPQVNCMHSKLMLLFHLNHLRIVIPSANLIPFDWGEKGGIMENVVFLIDLPRISPSPDATPRTPFLEDLVYFLQASNLDEQIIQKMLNFDFSATKDIAFVHTIGGSHTDPTWKRTGLCGLGRAITSLGLQTSQNLNLDYVTSSVGSLNEQFLRSIYLAAQGDTGLKELTFRTSRTLPSEKLGVLTTRTDGEKWRDRFKVYFPSLNTVCQSKGGTMNAGTICFQSKWYNSTTFPRNVMRNNISRRDGLLMHSKMLFACPDKPITSSKDNSTQYAGWAYVGSANLSESAWGRLVLDRSTTKPKLNCRNWECGVVIPIRHRGSGQLSSQPSSGSTLRPKLEPESESASVTVSDGSKLVSVFEPRIPVPMRVPGEPYQPGDKPWYYMEDWLPQRVA
ncbi:hypothetical protein ACO22_00772 [Paracoccidioides brasiliensis]|uniref:PLD phosphodiesterase domain-containing protein n=1 Tax=Paracoccidioides brasiliensis TaxID=121759 RepID=A0A1D2JNG3_PARBR|nr:hypothetical protein ACO22_00772 [Paracoccidioides brasiliensis]